MQATHRVSTNIYAGIQVPPKISSRMKSDQRVGMKVAGDDCRKRVARVKVAVVMVAGVIVAARASGGGCRGGGRSDGLKPQYPRSD
jgi:hypothetical protein